MIEYFPSSLYFADTISKMLQNCQRRSVLFPRIYSALYLFSCIGRVKHILERDFNVSRNAQWQFTVVILPLTTLVRYRPGQEASIWCAVITHCKSEYSYLDV